MVDPRQVVGSIIAVGIAILAYGTSTDVMGGEFSSLLPGWLGFATDHPTLFAFLSVVVVLLFGGLGAMLLDNI